MRPHRFSHLVAAVALSVACAAVLIAASPTPARTPAGPTLTVATDRTNAIYPIHAPVQFIITLRSEPPGVKDAEVEWTLSKDGVPPLTHGTVRLADGRATVTGTLDEPGFLQCRAVFRGTNQPARTAVAGAAIDPLEIPPSLPVPADFDDFWAAQKTKLAAVPVNARLNPVTSPATNVECFDLQADSLGAPVSGYYARPMRAARRSLPAILTVHGAGVRSSSLSGAAGWAGKGMLALDINAHGLPNGQPESFYTGLAQGELKEYRTRGRESRETIYFLGMFVRLVRAIDFLAAQPEWNGKTLIVHGSSQGGAQSIVAAGLDPRVSYFAAGVPAMCDHTGVAVGRVNGWPKFLANPPEAPASDVLDAVRYYDVMNFATRVRCPGIVTVGFIDTTCPPTSVYAAYNALAGPKQIFNDPPSTHTVSPRAAEAMRHAIQTHLEAPRFPKPDPAQTFPELKIFTPDGSPVRQPLEDWEGARRRVAEDPAWQRWLADQRADMDDWMARRHDRVEWISGWWHDFVSPKDGSFLTWTPDEPGEDTLSSPSDPKVKLTPKLHAAWVFGFRTRHAAKLVQAAQLFRLTGARPYADWAAAQLDFYATNYTRWPEKPGRGCRLMWQSLDEAVNLVKFSQTVRFLDDAVAPDRKQLWFDHFFRPQAAMLESTFQRIHNIACWHRAAVAHVALSFGNDALWQAAVEGARPEPVERPRREPVERPFALRQQLAQGVTSDYLWFEQSLGYNHYVVSALRPLFEAAALAGRAEELNTEMAIVENLLLAPIALRFQTGQLPNPADSTGGPGHAPNRAALAAAYRLFPTDLGLSEAARQRNWDTLLDPPSPPEHPRPLPPPASRNLESSRMAILRQGDWQAFFHYGQLDASHAQAEALNYELFLGDSDISHDPGTVGYGSPLHREYFTHGLAHNVPLVNGQGQAPWNPGQLLRFDTTACRVAARQPLYRPDCAAERELRIENGKLVDVVRLTLEPGSAPAALGLALHLQGQMRLPARFVPDPTFAREDRPAAFRHWTECRTAAFTNTAVLEATFGTRRLELTLSAPGRFTLTHASTPDVPPHRRESLYLETTGTAAEFTTTFAPAPAPSR